MACIRYAQRATLFDQRYSVSPYRAREPVLDGRQAHCTPRQHGKRPRDGSSTICIEDHEENDTMALKYIALFAKWVRGLRQAHTNCLNIPVALVIKMGIRMSHHIFLKESLEIKTETLAATFWVALKFFSSRDTIPNASFMSMVTGVTKEALLKSERQVLADLGWDLYSFYTTLSTVTGAE